MAGVTYQFRTNPASNLPSGGTWSCEYGTVTSSGDYSAPIFQPPWGQDTITYEAPNGDIARLDILITQNPSIPGSGYPKYIRVPAGTLATTSLEQNPTAEVIAGVGASAVDSGPLSDIATQYPNLPTYEAGEDALSAPNTTDCADLEPDTSIVVNNSSQNAATLNSQDVIGEVSDAMVVVIAPSLSQAQKPKKCVVWPVNPFPAWYNDPCTTGTTLSNDSKSKRQGPKLIPPLQNGQMQFSAEVEAKLGREGLGELGVGFKIGISYPVTRQITQWTETLKRDVYRCVNGAWKFQGTKTCSRTGHGEIAFPKWVAVIDGYPVNGFPNTWGPWNCN